MADEIEMNNLQDSETDPDPTYPRDGGAFLPIPGDDTRDATAASWSWLTASLLMMWACVLTLFPRLLLFAADEGYQLTQLEAFLSLHLGIIMASLSAAVLFNIPAAEPVPAREQSNPPIHPLIYPLSIPLLLSAFLAYNTTGVGALSTLYAFSTGLVGLFGLWAIVFNGTAALSKKTGADKHTSAFIFGNKSSASKQKKKWKQEQKRAER